MRDRPDIVTYMVALRSELVMRMVMPTVVSHTDTHKCMVIGRCEWGSGTGNPHTHGLACGAGNPVLSWEHEPTSGHAAVDGAVFEGSTPGPSLLAIDGLGAQSDMSDDACSGKHVDVGTPGAFFCLSPKRSHSGHLGGDAPNTIAEMTVGSPVAKYKSSYG